MSDETTSREDAAGAPEAPGVGEDIRDPLTSAEQATLEALMAAVDDPSRGIMTPGLNTIHLHDHDALQQRFNTILHASLVDLLDQIEEAGGATHEVAAHSIMTMLGEVARLTTETTRKAYEQALRDRRGRVSTEGPGERLEG